MEKELDTSALETFKLDLLFERLQINPADQQSVARVNILTLSRFGLTTLKRLIPFMALRHLDVSNNSLTYLEQEVLLAMPWLTHLGMSTTAFRRH